MSDRELFVVFACDTEDNHPNYVPGWASCGSNYDSNPANLNWSWTKYWRDLSECFTSQSAPVTWLARVDAGPCMDQMLTLFKDTFLELKSVGDEIGIHIHTWKWNSELSRWAQTTIPEEETEIVFDSVKLFQKKLGFASLSVRMGWNTMSNAIMRALDANGLIADATAIPQSSSPGKFGKRDNIYDWSRVTSAPYHPSPDDYQSAGNMKILEIPISSLPLKKPTMLSTLVNKLSGTSSLVKLLPIARRLNLTPHHHFYITPWWSSSIYSKIIKIYGERASEKGVGFLIGTFHPNDILNPKTGTENLLFKRCISKVINDIVSLQGITIRFITLSELAQNLNKNPLHPHLTSR